MGAWAVQYYLLKMLGENTGDFFTPYQKQTLLGSAQDILKTRFCGSAPLARPMRATMATSAEPS